MWLVQLFPLVSQAGKCMSSSFSSCVWSLLQPFSCDWEKNLTSWVSEWFREILWKVKIRPMLTQGIWGDEGEFGSHWTLGVPSCWYFHWDLLKKKNLLVPPYKELPLPNTNSFPLITKASSTSKRCFWHLGLSAWKSLPNLLTFKNQQ